MTIFTTFDPHVGGGAGDVTTLVPDSGTSTTSASVALIGRSGAKTLGTGNDTIIVKSPPYADAGSSGTTALNSGEFATAAITRTLPATAGLEDGDVVHFVASTADALVIQLAATQVGHLGNQATSAAGSFTSTAIGDSLVLRYQASTNDWWAVSSIGNWTVA